MGSNGNTPRVSHKKVATPDAPVAAAQFIRKRGFESCP